MNLLSLRSSSSIDELLVYLVRVERVLARVRQDPPMSVMKVLLPAMTALIKDELSKKTSERVIAGSSTVEKGEVEKTNMPSDSSQGIIGKREMVNVRIMVRWPMDKTFYTGRVEAFDPLTKKHKIKYDDDDDDYEEEALNLREKRWELINGKQPRQVRIFVKNAILSETRSLHSISF